MSLYLGIPDGDWHWMDEDQAEAVLQGARDAFSKTIGPSDGNLETVEDFEQNALIYAATHRRVLEEKAEPRWIRIHIRDRLVENWHLARKQRPVTTPMTEEHDR